MFLLYHNFRIIQGQICICQNSFFYHFLSICRFLQKDFLYKVFLFLFILLSEYLRKSYPHWDMQFYGLFDYSTKLSTLSTVFLCSWVADFFVKSKHSFCTNITIQPKISPLHSLYPASIHGYNLSRKIFRHFNSVGYKLCRLLYHAHSSHWYLTFKHKPFLL